VDHGKTTLSDSLMARAGAKSKGTTCALDTLKDEQQRGITIQSTAVHLELTVPERALQRGKTRSEREHVHALLAGCGSGGPTTTLYVGNLPFGASPAEVLGALGVPASAAERVDVRGKRGWALVALPRALADHVLQSAAGGRVSELGGRALVLEPRGEGPLQQLREECAARDLSSHWCEPDASETSTASAGERVAAVELRNGAEELVVRVTGRGTSLKLAKAAAASAALRQLPSRSASPEGEEGAASDASTDTEEAKTPSGGTAAGAKRNALQVNVVDCPGHVDFAAEVTAALRLCDGALVVVDVVEGVCVQTEAVLTQALQERVRPVLVLNKMDRLALELRLTPEEAAARVDEVVRNVNSLIRELGPRELGVDWRVSLRDGSVVLASGYFGWAFTLQSWLRAVARSGGDASEVRSQLMARDKRGGAASSCAGANASALARLVLGPLFETHTAIEAGDVGGTARALEALPGSQLEAARVEAAVQGGCKEALRALVGGALPAADGLLDAIAARLPSPAEAQSYRAECMYPAPVMGAAAEAGEEAKDCDDAGPPAVWTRLRAAVERCDPSSALLAAVSKVVVLPPMGDKGGKVGDSERAGGALRLGALCRVYAGTLRVGDRVRVIGAAESGATDDAPSSTSAEAEGGRAVWCTVQRVLRLRATRCYDAAGGVLRAGDVGAVVGVEAHMVKGGTLTTEAEAGAGQLRMPRPLVAPVVRVAVRPTRPADAARLRAGLSVLSRLDPCAAWWVDEETRQLVLAGAGELHLEVCLSRLEDLAQVPVTSSQPLVAYREAVGASACGAAGAAVTTKSRNKHNRVTVVASALPEALVRALECGTLGPQTPPQTLVRALVDEHGWEPAHARKVWAWGPEGNPNNVLVDCTVGIHNVRDLQAGLVAAFHKVTRTGPLAGEALRGVRFDVVDVRAHADGVHRRDNQVVPMATRAFQAAALAAAPVLLEPTFELHVRAPPSMLKHVCGVLHARRAQVLGTEAPVSLGSGAAAAERHLMVARLPVAASFGVLDDLRGACSGRAQAQFRAGPWEVLPGDPAAASSGGGAGKDKGKSKGRGAGGGAGVAGGASPLSGCGDAASVVAALRELKGMAAGVPLVADLVDRV